MFAWILFNGAAFCGNNFKNNRLIQKELPERIIASSKITINSPLVNYNIP